MVKVPNGIETLPKISAGCVGRTSVTDRQTTDGRVTAYSERELELTFAESRLNRQLLIFMSPGSNFII